MIGRLNGRVAVVTGGASGIGEATVRRFIAEGARVVVADVQGDAGQALQSELGDRTRFIQTDVSQEADVAATVDLAVSSFGRLDVMFNNAGILGAVGRLVDTTAGAWHATLGVLLDGVFFGMKHAARVMIPQGSGVIVSTASIAGITGGVGPHAYTASKHAVIGLTRSAASELGQYGIRVNAIAPGNTVTAMTAAAITGDPDQLEEATRTIASSSLLGIPGLPSDIANAALYLSCDESRYVSGHTLVIDAGHTSNGGSARVHRARPALLAEAGRRTPTTASPDV